MRNLLGLAVEARHAALVHHADPDIAVGIHFEVERALRMVRLQHRDREVASPCRSSDRAWTGTARRNASTRPRRRRSTITSCGWISFRGRSYSVMMTRVARPLGARRGLELEAMRRGVLLRLSASRYPAKLSASAGLTVGPPMRADQPLRLHVGGARIVGAHALEHLQEVVAVVLRFENAVQRMAVRAVEQVALQIVRARRARQHLGSWSACSNSTAARP